MTRLFCLAHSPLLSPMTEHALTGGCLPCLQPVPGDFCWGDIILSLNREKELRGSMLSHLATTWCLSEWNCAFWVFWVPSGQSLSLSAWLVDSLSGASLWRGHHGGKQWLWWKSRSGRGTVLLWWSGLVTLELTPVSTGCHNASVAYFHLQLLLQRASREWILSPHANKASHHRRNMRWDK